MNERVASCLLIAKVLVADGMMADHERAFLAHAMETMALSEDEQRVVRNLDGFDEAAKVVSALPEARRRAIVDQLVEAALSDGKLSPHETRTVSEITKALGLS
jgi:uncharacterized tellurite resistance protein B-like protein